MLIGAVWEPGNNAQYRVVGPLKALERRGHSVVWPDSPTGEPSFSKLKQCDVVHVYRRCDHRTIRVAQKLGEAGIPITWDNDDDFSSVPKEAANHRDLGGLSGRRVFSLSVRIARMAALVTTPSEVLATKYRDAGARNVIVAGNYLLPQPAAAATHHRGIVVGWVAAAEHQAEVARVPIRPALERLVSERVTVGVECIGIDLRLPQGYRHTLNVEFADLRARISGFDIGIAPLADIPFNWSRSDIKLKEYGAASVPWLASPIGPYIGLGSEEGGQLVGDEGWYDALATLVSKGRARRRLARKAKAWADRNTILRAAQIWEDLFASVLSGEGEPVRDAS